MKTVKVPMNPGKVLTKALQLGLTSTAYLARCRVTKATKHLYWGGKGRKGIRRMMNDALSDYQKSVKERRPNAKYLQRYENNIRRNHNKTVLNRAVAYGNTEEKRRRRDEDRKYINTLADYFGAKIRNIGTSKFQFQVPSKVCTSSGDIKRFYPGNSRIPEYVPRHVAPELDFMDMIRSLGIEFASQCMNYSVPMREAKRYLDRLVDLLIPYLEYVYTEGREGKKGFILGGARELREIITEIRTLYGGVNGRPQSITGEVSGEVGKSMERSAVPDDIDFLEVGQAEILRDEKEDRTEFETMEEENLDTFFEHFLDRCDTITNPHWKVHVEQAKSLVKRKILIRKDAEYILNLILEDSRRIGSAFHDFIANSEFTVRPFSLLGPIKYGDEMVTENTDLLFTCETSVASGRGRIDILVFRRKYLERVDESPSRVVWEPCILIEIKTKNFYGLDLYATTTKSKDTRKRVAEPVLEKRRSEKPEWKEIVDSTPDKHAKEQLEAYEKAILSEYRKYVRSDFDPPQHLMKGVLVVDLAENWEVLRDNIKSLILQAYHFSQETTLTKRHHFYPILRGDEIRMGLVLFSDCESRKTVSVENVIEFNPFSRSRNRDDDREFILYLTVSSKGSPSISAAEIATKWHGSKFIHERTKGKHRDVLWLDLTGEYRDFVFRKQNLSLILQSRSVQDLARERIAFVDISEEMTPYLNERTSIENLDRKIRESFYGKRRAFIVVTGSDKLRESIPREKMALLDGFIIWFIEQVPRQSSVLWFDKPVPTIWTSQEYDTRGVAPFYSNSPWRYVIDEIVYNVPIAPRRYRSYVPADDDVRWIVTEDESNLSNDTELIPPLYLWGERFRPDSSREDNIDRQQIFYLRSTYSSTRRHNLRKYDEEDFDGVLELIPHLNRFYERMDFNETEIQYDNEEVKVMKEELSGDPANPVSILSRAVFTPNQALTSIEKDGRATRLMPLTAINTIREYRQTRLLAEPKKETSRPPHMGLLRYHRTSLLTFVRKELSGLRRIVKVIERRRGEEQEWKEFLDSLKLLLRSELISDYKQDDVLNVLRSVHVFLETHEISRGVWNAIKPSRTWIPDGLSDEGQMNLKILLARDPDLLLLVGNHLFLLLLASLYEANVMNLSTGFIERLWNYLLPFQMTGIGFQPEYHSQHNTGTSFLHRTKLINRLATWARNLKQIQSNQNIDEILFGKAYFIGRNKSEPPSHILLVFQKALGSHKMSMAFLKAPPEIKSSIHEVLRMLCQDRPFWGTSDLLTLRDLAQSVSLDNAIDIMIASQNGTRGLWICDNSSSKWIPIGEFNYYSRKRETVTLLMSTILREDSTLKEVPRESIRTAPKNLKESIDIGLQLISASFRTCVPVRCHVSLDHGKKMFRISFVKPKSKKEVGELLIKRTTDILEILRRPDVLCEPVVIEGKRCIWSRFDDIEYDEDVKILRLYAIRNNPFKIDSLALPHNAEIFLSLKKESILRVKILHIPYVCPLRSMRLENLTQQSYKSTSVVDHLRIVDGHPGQPEQLFNESIHRHGTCWRLSFESEKSLPTQVREIEKIKFGGPALATFLETGVVFYSTSNGDWISHEMQVTESRDLPKEFRESIYLMRWRKETATYPGFYLLDDWTPEIRIYKNRIDFKIVSKLTLQEKTHSIFEANAEYLNKDKLRLLLKRGMSRILEIGGFSESSTMKQLGNNEIASQLSHIKDVSDIELQYESVEVAKDRTQEQVVVANFVTQDGEDVSIQITEQILTYKDWTIMSGGIDFDALEVEISERLHGRNIKEECLHKIAEKVKELLKERGVVFFDDQ
jgi:hypothetical protein